MSPAVDRSESDGGAAPEPLGRGDLQQRAVRGALWVGVHTLVSLPVAFAVNILLARILGVEDYGRLTYLTTVIGIATTIAGMGVTTAVIQFGSKAHARGDRAEVRRLLSGAQGFRLMVVGPIVALTVLALVRVDWWLLALALLFGVGLPALLSNAHPALTIENRTDRSAQLTMIGNVVTQSFVVLSVLTIGSPDAVWSARVVASGLLLALPLLVISAPYRRAVLSPSPPWRLPRRFWAFAVPTGAAGIIGTLVSSRTEVIFLEWFADEYAMGLFGLAFGLAGHVYAPAQAFVGPLIPAISGLAEVDRGSVREAFLRTTRAGCSVGGALVVTALPALAILVPLIYGSRFAPASEMLLVLGLGSAVVLVSSPHMAFLMARLGGRRILWVNVAALVINLGLAFAMIPFFGAWGAVIACAGGMLVQALMVSAGEVRHLEVSAVDLIRSVGAMLVALPIAIGAWFATGLVEKPLIWLAVCAALVGGLAYVVMIRLLRIGLTGQDVRAISRGLPRALARPGRSMLLLLQGGGDR